VFEAFRSSRCPYGAFGCLWSASSVRTFSPCHLELDMTCTCPSSAASGAVASEAADNHVKDGDDAVHDSHNDGADGVDNCHKGSANGLKDARNTRDDGTHCECFCVIRFWKIWLLVGFCATRRVVVVDDVRGRKEVCWL